MKVLLAGLLTLGIGVLLWYAMSMASSIHMCTTTYQDDLTSVRVQIDTVRGDHPLYCSTSYELISSWEACIASAPMKTPSQFLNIRLKPLVMNITHIAGDPSGNIQAIKLDHDDVCKDQTNSMFYPPELSK